MNRIASGILFLSLSWLLPQPSVAGPVIYDNGVTISTSFSTAGTSVFFADNFQLTPGQTTIADVHWRGLYAGAGGLAPTPPGIDRFAIRIFQSVNPAFPQPFGAPILQVITTFPNNPSRTDTGQLLGDFHIYEFSLDLPSPITLLANTTYWLSIDFLPGPLNDNAWFWGAEPAAFGPGHTWLTTSGGGTWTPFTFNSSHWEMDFQLTGPSSAVPEPITLALLGLGLAGLGFARWRKVS